MRLPIALILSLAVTLPGWAETRPPAGLLWNRSGLPATLPLVVQTMPGRDHVVFLDDPADNRPVMAGYIRGGEFFRLLVPPGSWRIHLVHGTVWQNERDLFGKTTQISRLNGTLRFDASVAQRRGHVIRLDEGIDGSARLYRKGPLDLCQRMRVTSQTTDLDVKSRDPFRLPAPALRRTEFDSQLRTVPCG